MNTPLTLTDALGNVVVISPAVEASHLELRDEGRGLFRVTACLVLPGADYPWDDHVRLEYDSREGAEQALEDLRSFLIDRFLRG